MQPALKAQLKRFFAILAVFIAASTGLYACARREPAPVESVVSAGTPTGAPRELPADGVRGWVVDEQGAPVAGAEVRVQASENATTTDAQGGFELTGLAPAEQVTVSAWKEDYYCASAQAVQAPAGDVTLTLRPIQTSDNPDYAWVAPSGQNSCYSCKPAMTQVWLDNDAHGRSATNARFLSMYNGSDLSGNTSPLTRFVFRQDYGQAPLAPDPDQPYYGPGYKLDFPDTAGNCAACHVPGAAVDDPYGSDPNAASGVNALGVHCDFCHKVADVHVEAATGLPYPNRPGVLSMDIRRPFPDDPERFQLFFGTFADDNVPAEDTYLPLIEESQWCAACHYGVFWDTVVYNSYGEWLESPYSDPESGKTCQTCHMPAPTEVDGQALSNIAPDKGGVERDPATIHAHTFPGASSEELLQNAVTMQAAGRRDGARVVVEVAIANDQTGHHVPTDSPLRQMILLVAAKDAAGQPLALVDGPTLPGWAGTGDPAQGYYAGLPGKAYAKILSELWTEISPSGAYWNPTRIESDNRLAAFAEDTSTYRFAAPEAGAVEVAVTLLYRRAFKELMDQKGWDAADIVMEYQSVQVR